MDESGLERKFCHLEAVALSPEGEGMAIEGYASRFGQKDRGGDVVLPGAFGAALTRMQAEGRQVKLLWQHDPAQPIGVWDEVREDQTGLWVKGRLLPEVARAREARVLLEAGALDGLSIGYRTIRAEKAQGGGRRLAELDLWEVSLVTFPMLPTARVAQKGHPQDRPVDPMVEALIAGLDHARGTLAAARHTITPDTAKRIGA